MRRYPRRFWMLAALLAALAGYVDAIGFLQLGGLFVSFMSGNTTRLAVGLAGGSVVALRAGGLIAAFVGGVILGSLVASAARPWRKPAVLALMTGLLAAAALVASTAGMPAAACLLAAAMGSENAVFQRDGEVSIGLTYMTGTLVKLGQRLAAAIRREDRWGWVPHLLLWTSLASGAVAGAAVEARLGPNAIWTAAGLAALLAILARMLDRGGAARV